MTTKAKPTHHEATHGSSHATAATAPPPSTAAPASTEAAQPAPKATATTPNAASLITTIDETSHRSKVDFQTQFSSLIYGLLTNYQPTDVFHTSQGIFTRDALVAKLNSLVGVFQSTKLANQKWRAAIQEERSALITGRQLRLAVKGIVQGRFGRSAAQVLQFGFSIPKAPKRTAKTKAVAAEKSKATRTARNTMGSVQKKAVKGNVAVALVVTPGGTVASNAKASEPVETEMPGTAGIEVSENSPAPTIAPAAAPQVVPAAAAPAVSASAAQTAAPIAPQGGAAGH